MTLSKQNCCDNQKPPVIESVRQNLIEKVQHLQLSIGQRDDSAQIITMIDEIKYQSVYYFTQKEKLLIMSRNLSYHHHRQAHDRFIWKITDLASAIESNHYKKALGICKELQKWLCDHRTASGQEFRPTHFNCGAA